MKKITLIFTNLTLQKKIFITGSIIIFSFLIIIFGYLFPGMNENIVSMKKIKLKEITRAGISIVHHYYRQHQEGKISEEKAKSLSLEALRKIRYGPENKDYLWINDFHPRMVMHPYVTKLEGKDLNGFKDRKGFPLFKEMVEVCSLHGEGFVSYMWQWKDQKDKIVPKISFVKSFNPWGWIIGTGLYVHDAKSEIDSIQGSLKQNLIILFIAISVFLFFLLFRLARAISRPIRRILDFSEKLSEGRLKERISVTGEDELGKLSRSLNYSVESLEGLFLQIRNDIAVLTRRIELITEDNTSLSMRISSQASTVEEISSTVELSNVSMQNNRDNVNRASSMAEKSLTTAENGGEKIHGTINSIGLINDSSKKISKILSVINEIAFQTNLLALNASVEAARAGDHGRGFAVVAGEVRNLAQRSAGAAKDIDEIIRETIQLVDSGVLEVNKSKESLDEIIQEASKVLNVVSEIDSATSEQINGMEQIRIALAEIEKLSNENVIFVDKTANAGKEMTEQAENLVTLINRFEFSEVSSSE